MSFVRSLDRRCGRRCQQTPRNRWQASVALAAALSAAACLLCLTPPARGEVVLANGATACTVRTGSYRLLVDVGASNLFVLQTPQGKTLWPGVSGFAVTADGQEFEWRGSPAPHLHTLRAGPHLVEFCLENIVLKADDTTWPGLAELHVTCQEQKVYLHVRFLLPASEWVNAGRFVYRRPEVHPTAAACAPSDARMILRAEPTAGKSADAIIIGNRPCMAIVGTLPRGRPGLLSEDAGNVALIVPVGEGPLHPGDAREAACALLIARGREEIAVTLDAERHPLDASAFRTGMGQCEGFDPRTGLYVFRAETSPSPEPPPGLRAGAAFSVTNDSRPRTILADSFDPWGGICGGLVRDEDGSPLPIRVQFGLNFPELRGEAEESGWATLTFPLSLQPQESRGMRVEHLYGGARDHDLLYLTSLENVGGPLLYQATVSRLESFTVTSGGELRINDFRRHYRDLKVRSVSAILPTFFGYFDADDRYQGLAPGETRIVEGGPFFAEMAISARTADGSVSGEIRLWETPCSDMTRLFSEVQLRVNKEVRLSSRRAAPLFFLRHHAFNPMAYRRFAAWVEPGEPRVGELNFAPEVAADGLPLARQPFGVLYQASNGIDQGIPCSDITGNPGWVLLDADVRMGDKPLPLGVYAFATGPGDAEHGDYARDLAVVPARRVEVLPAGTIIRYRALQVVYGDNSSDYASMVSEREAWAVRPPQVEASVGAVVSHNPPHVRAVDDAAEFTIDGGADWIAVRVSGLRSAGRLEVWRRADDGTKVALTDASSGEPWYIAWPDDDGGVGYTFLVKLPGDGSPVSLGVGTASQALGR